MAQQKWTWVVILSLLIILPGCGDGGGGGGVSTAEVRGSVYYNGNPVTNKDVLLINSNGGSTVTTKTDAVTGEFTFNGVIPGKYTASCTVVQGSPGVVLTCPDSGDPKTVTLSGPNDFSIGQMPPPGPPTDL